MMPIGRMRPEDFDAVFRLLSQSFPAGAQGTVDCADLLSMAMMIDARREIKQHSARRESAGAVLFSERAMHTLGLHAVHVRQNSLRDGECEG